MQYFYYTLYRYFCQHCFKSFISHTVFACYVGFLPIGSNMLGKQKLLRNIAVVSMLALVVTTFITMGVAASV
jgi:hypothetical protein